VPCRRRHSRLRRGQVRHAGVLPGSLPRFDRYAHKTLPFWATTGVFARSTGAAGEKAAKQGKFGRRDLTVAIAVGQIEERCPSLKFLGRNRPVAVGVQASPLIAQPGLKGDGPIHDRLAQLVDFAEIQLAVAVEVKSFKEPVSGRNDLVPGDTAVSFGIDPVEQWRGGQTFGTGGAGYHGMKDKGGECG